MSELLDAMRIGAGASQALALDPGSEPPPDACAIPLTAGDETLALVLLDAPPRDPVGFASVTAHAASLLARIRMAERLREKEFELKYRVWELESLYDVGLSIASTLDVDSLADDILMKSVSLLNARKGTLIIRDVSGHGQVLVKEFGGLLFGGEEALQLPDVMVLANTRESRVGVLADAEAEKLLAAPIVSDGKRLGVLVVADKENRAGGVDDWTEADKRILSLFGNQAAIALENARLHREAVEKERIEREIELAASIQKTILPDSLPKVPGLVLAGGNRPTRSVGGDYFDVFPLTDGRTALCVADVSGKGVPAALLVSTVHACLHLLVPDGADDLAGLVARVNRHLRHFSSTHKFVTLFIGVFDPSTSELTYVNAGHNPGLVVSDGGFVELPSGGLPVGMFPEVSHVSSRVRLAPGDLLVLYSDGITEAVDTADEEFGMGRLLQLVTASRGAPTAEVSAAIFSAVQEFTRGVAQYDDQTVLLAQAV
jgi:sigma-B regulation protein RsbU (phosphoserine phosphatase)